MTDDEPPREEWDDSDDTCEDCHGSGGYECPACEGEIDDFDCALCGGDGSIVCDCCGGECVDENDDDSEQGGEA